MKISKKRQKINLLVIIIAVALLLLASSGFVYWYFNGLDKEQVTDDEVDSASDSTLVTQIVDDSNLPSIENKTPIQYDGQTPDNNNANSDEFGDEQFRIPEGEL